MNGDMQRYTQGCSWPKLDLAEAKIPVVVRSLSAKARWREGPFVARSAPARVLRKERPEICLLCSFRRSTGKDHRSQINGHTALEIWRQTSHSETPKIPRSAMTYPSLGPVSIDSLRLPKTCSIGWSVSSCIPDSDSQSIEDNGLIERIDESASRRRLAAFRSEMIDLLGQFSLQGCRGNAWYGSPRVDDLCPLFRRIDVHHSEREVHNPPASSD